jgi:hypothetical protein
MDKCRCYQPRSLWSSVLRTKADVIHDRHMSIDLTTNLLLSVLTYAQYNFILLILNINCIFAYFSEPIAIIE